MPLALRLVLAVGLAATGALVALFGVFLLLYDRDSTHYDPYIEFAGREVNSQLVGAAGLAVAVGLFLCAWLALRRRPS